MTIGASATTVSGRISVVGDLQAGSVPQTIITTGRAIQNVTTVTTSSTISSGGSLTVNGNNLIFAGGGQGDGKLYFSGTGTASQYNYFLKADNDTGRKAVMFVNGSTRSADGGPNTFTIRNDGGPSRFGNSAYVTTLEGSTIKANGTTEVLTSEFRVTSGSSYTTHLNYQNNGQNFISQATSGGLTQFRNSNGSLMEIAATGNVTIANSLTVQQSFSVTGSNGNVVIGSSGNNLSFSRNGDNYIEAQTGTSSNIVMNPQNRFAVHTNDLERFRVDSSGRLLFGKTSTALNTAGVELHADRIYATRSSGQALAVNRQHSNGAVISLHRDGTEIGTLGVAGSANLTVNSRGSGGYGRLQDNGSDVAIWWTHGFYPSIDNAKDLGVNSTSGRWRNLFMASGIYMAGSQIVDASRNLTNINSISSGNITTGSSSGATLKITTNAAAGSIASKLPLHLDFLGYGNTPMARIRSWDESQSTADGFLEFYTNNYTGSHSLRRVLLLDNEKKATFFGVLATGTSPAANGTGDLKSYTDT